MTTFTTAPPIAPVRPLPVARLARLLALLALTFLTVALIGVALLGTSPSPFPEAAARNGLIAFDAERDIWVVNPDGTGLRRVAETPDSETSPVWSPDGSRLAVWLTSAGGTSIAIMDADGATERTIAAPDGAIFPTAITRCNGLARWSPDGRTLAATPLTSRLGEAVVILDVESGEGHLLDVGMQVCGFAWSPDGSLLAFTGGDQLQHSLYVSRPDGSGLRALSPEGQTVGVQPDATTPFAQSGWIAAERVGSSATDDVVVAFGLDGSQRTLAPGFAASISPDDRWISFLHGDWRVQTPRELRVAPVDGSSGPRLVSAEVCCTALWSPDGTRLAAWTPAWDEFMIVDPFGDAEPIRVPSPANIGVLSWQAVR